MTYLKFGAAAAAISVIALVSCSEEPPIIAQTNDIDVFAKSFLNNLQPVSIAEDREYCGYFFKTDAGQLAATAPLRGNEDSCDLYEPDDNVLASYHTHGGFSDLYDNEVPSPDDVNGDFESKIDGYISTPAGRIWLVDFSAQIARQLCSETCVTSDPDTSRDDSEPVPQSFTLQELNARFQ